MPQSRGRTWRLTPRAATALGLLLALSIGLAWLASDAPSPPASGPVPHAVYVVGPTTLLHSGNVSLEDATALAALQTLASAQGFTLDVDDWDGCTFDYVRAIAGHAETASGGWNYYVRSTHDWVWQDEAASCRALAPGEAVLWCWVEPDERCAVQP